VLIEVDGLRKTYRHRGSAVAAVDGVSFAIERGETVGLVGESGSGKSTVGRCIVGLTAPEAGRISIAGRELAGGSRGRQLLHRHVQMVFQDPAGSMNPAYTVRGWLADALRPLGLARGERQARVGELLEQVGLGPRFLERRARELSGGQLQRVAIARALAAEPDFVFLDEPTSALDLSVRGQIVNLLRELQAERGYAYLFASHDLGVVRAVAQRVLVMYLGRVVEAGTTEQVLTEPAHPYTRALLASAGLATAEPDAQARGEIAWTGASGGGCSYADRCPFVHDRCREESPLLEELRPGHTAACWLVSDGRHGTQSAAPAVAQAPATSTQGGNG
jgi:oligopeptide/dipeptide ABC transporter ATP-binding protein